MKILEWRRTDWRRRRQRLRLEVKCSEQFMSFACAWSVFRVSIPLELMFTGRVKLEVSFTDYEIRCMP